MKAWIDLSERMQKMAEWCAGITKVKKKGRPVYIDKDGREYIPESEYRLRPRVAYRKKNLPYKYFDDDLYINTSEAANLLNLNHRTAREILFTKKVTHIKQGSCYYFLFDDVEKIKQGEQPLDVLDRNQNEIFKHRPRTEKDESHIMVGDFGTVINLTTGRVYNRKVAAGNGHLQVTIDNKDILIHRLVAELFCHNMKGKTEVHHMNRIKTDNRATNLIWCTIDEHRKLHQLLKAIYDAPAEEKSAKQREYDDYLRWLMHDNETK